MKQLLFFFMALMISQNLFAQTCTPLSVSPGNVIIYWSGAVSTDWNTACNWSPAWVPDETNAFQKNVNSFQCLHHLKMRNPYFFKSLSHNCII